MNPALVAVDAAQVKDLPAESQGALAQVQPTGLYLGSDGAIDGAVVRMAARVIREASLIDSGFGNLRFAALANVRPGTSVPCPNKRTATWM